jgi:RecJ-like exonuclease
MPQKADTLILTHSDCDGICAGALALSRFPGARLFFTKPVSLLHDLEETAIPLNPKKLVICDIAITKSHAAEIVKRLKDIKGTSDILYFDHHTLPSTTSLNDVEDAVSTLAHDTGASASEIVYRYFQKSLAMERIWLALYGAIGDYTDDTEFVMERMRNWDKRALYFEVSTLILGIKDERFSTYNAKRRICNTLATGGNPSDIRGLALAAKSAVTREFHIYKQVKRRAKMFGNIGFVKDLPKFGFRGPSALFAATVTDRPVGLSIHTIRDRIDITARKRVENPNIQLNKIMEKAAESVGGSGGGHARAAGARIPKGRLNKFLEEVDKMI